MIINNKISLALIKLAFTSALVQDISELLSDCCNQYEISFPH